MLQYMAESKLGSPIKLFLKTVTSYYVSSVAFMCSVAKALDHILISDLVVTNLFMHSLPVMILLYLATLSHTEGVFA